MPDPSLILQGAAVTLHCPAGAQPKSLQGSKRGEVSLFMTRESRRRFMYKCASVDWQSISETGNKVWFCTLSLPKEYWNEPDFTKAGVKRFRERFRYAFKDKCYLGSLVRRELGSGGNVHYHALFIGPNIEWSELALWVRETWRECLRYGELAPCTADYIMVDVQEAEDPERVAKYIGKYMTKAAYDGSSESIAFINRENEESAKLDNPASSENSGTNFTEGGGGGVHESLFNVHTGPQNDNECENAGDSLQGALSLTNAHSSRKWGRHWTVWESDTIPWAETYIMEDVGGHTLKAGLRVKRVFRNWLERQAVQALIRSFYTKDDNNRNIYSMCGYFKIYDMFKIMLRRELRKARKRGGKLPYYETLRRSPHYGYTLFMNEEMRDNLISWAAGFVPDVPEETLGDILTTGTPIQPDTVYHTSAIPSFDVLGVPSSRASVAATF